MKKLTCLFRYICLPLELSHMVSFFGDFIIASFENKFVKNFVDLSTENGTKYTCFIYEKCVLRYTINDTFYADNEQERMKWLSALSQFITPLTSHTVPFNSGHLTKQGE